MQNITILNGVLSDARDRSVYVLETAYRKMRACAYAAHSCSAFRCFPLCLYRRRAAIYTRRAKSVDGCENNRYYVPWRRLLKLSHKSSHQMCKLYMHVLFFFTKRIWLFSSCDCLSVTHSNATYTHCCFALSRWSFPYRFVCTRDYLVSLVSRKSLVFIA